MENILKKSYKMFINGEWVNSSNGVMVKTYAPYNNELLSEFPDASESDVDLAVKSAKEAFKTWRKTTVKERARILNKIADIIDENRDLLATVETMDNEDILLYCLDSKVIITGGHRGFTVWDNSNR